MEVEHGEALGTPAREPLHLEREAVVIRSTPCRDEHERLAARRLLQCRPHVFRPAAVEVHRGRRLEDHELRKSLWERLQFSLDGEPDPWFEQDKAAVDTRQFTKLEAAGQEA